MPYRFTSPPAPGDRPRDNRLMRHIVPPSRGRHVVREAGVWKTLDSLTTDRAAAAEVVCYGGHETVVSNAHAAELVSAGYGSNLEEIV